MNETLQESKKYLSKFGIELDEKEIVSEWRDGILIFQRALIAFYLRKRADKVPFEEIGEILGGRTHATIINLLNYGSKKHKYFEQYCAITTKILIDLGKTAQEVAEHEDKMEAFSENKKVKHLKIMFLDRNNPKDKRKKMDKVHFSEFTLQKMNDDSIKHKKDIYSHLENIFKQYCKGNYEQTTTKY